jgi:hypothetical protein
MDRELAAITAILRLTDQRIRLLGLQPKAAEGTGDLRALVSGPIS